ncbi:unnamed protein product [Prunus armeniaca]|uniref:Protein FAR1-RELATED SEQUENCE n=1 Tax=Prunus armeniaca TaxID=36596 RepID=A0A6J5UTQ5_PRUAR|nr:unnamed protein product [Prunus armeniaca]
MAMKQSNNIWIRRRQCSCGDWKCYIHYEVDDLGSVSSQHVKSETTPSSSSSEAVFTPYVGQIFKTDDDAFEYYSNFARKNGQDLINQEKRPTWSILGRENQYDADAMQSCI